ncbi:MAG TPA: DNA-3-methyladenine glycosylase 2 family protein [Vicinamibacterales bacterium]|nr:DNA-3-methyladenine glycosylase 2 family protein [Vicinamibacterales bacterium]
MSAPMSAEDFARARRTLLRRDAILAPVIRKYKHRTILETPAIDPFSALVRTITSQQLSTKAAATIHRRILDLMPGGVATPESIEKTTDEQLRAAGLSRQKIAYVRDLAKHASTGDLPLHDLKTLSDDDVIAAITRVKGLGRWSAEMFLMFRLHRADVLPVDDLGIVVAVQRLYGLRKRPKPDRLRKIAEPWRPYRTVACWYLWRSLENTED